LGCGKFGRKIARFRNGRLSRAIPSGEAAGMAFASGGFT
jgi:hypothetical protein